MVGVWFEVALVGGTVGGGEAKETTRREGLAEAGEVRAEGGGERRRHARRCEFGAAAWEWCVDLNMPILSVRLTLLRQTANLVYSLRRQK